MAKLSRIGISLSLNSLFLLVFLIFTMILDPKERSFLIENSSIQKPYVKHDQVSTGAVTSISIVFVILYTILLISQLSRKFWSHVFLCICWIDGLVLNTASTLLMKVTLSRLRPDFLSRCLPDLKETKRIHEMQLRQHGFLTAYPYQCTGDDSIIREGRLSFPSGHSSISMWSTTVCIGFAALAAISHRKRQKNRQSSHRTIPQIEEQLSIPSTFSSVEHSSKDAIYSVPRKPAYFRCESNIQSGSTLSLILTVASLLPLLTTCFIAITRIVDHRHHPSDIFGGITVGGLSGLWTLLLVYHTI